MFIDDLNEILEKNCNPKGYPLDRYKDDLTKLVKHIHMHANVLPRGNNTFEITIINDFFTHLTFEFLYNPHKDKLYFYENSEPLYIEFANKYKSEFKKIFNDVDNY